MDRVDSEVIRLGSNPPIFRCNIQKMLKLINNDDITNYTVLKKYVTQDTRIIFLILLSIASVATIILNEYTSYEILYRNKNDGYNRIVVEVSKV